MKTVALLIVVTLAGCASPSPVWRKAGAAEQDFQSDLGVCRAQAFGTANVTLLQAAIVQNSCLQGKGWRQVSQ